VSATLCTPPVRCSFRRKTLQLWQQFVLLNIPFPGIPSDGDSGLDTHSSIFNFTNATNFGDFMLGIFVTYSSVEKKNQIQICCSLNNWSFRNSITFTAFWLRSKRSAGVSKASFLGGLPFRCCLFSLLLSWHPLWNPLPPDSTSTPNKPPLRLQLLGENTHATS